MILNSIYPAYQTAQTHKRAAIRLAAFGLLLSGVVALPRAAHAQSLLVDSDIVTSGAGTTTFSGTYVNNLVGANTFYTAGYTGSASKIANIEAGYIWDGHETLTRATRQIHDPSVAGQFDVHATAVGSAIGGAGAAQYQKGIAPTATLWTGAVATSFIGTGGQFNTNATAAGYAYYTAMTTDPTLGKADVVNSSWGYAVPSGYDAKTIFVDALAYDNGNTVVASTGNTGPSANSVGGIAAGFNTIAVGALGTNGSEGYNTNPNLYKQVATFSSRGPNDYADNNGVVTAGVRAAVDIVAPGQDLTLAYYGGTTGSNTGGTDTTGGAGNYYAAGEAGTSFSAPIVAGGAGLIADVGHTIYSADANATDGRVVKAILLNSADKLTGWSSAEAVNGSNVLRTTQALDYSQGAGALNLTNAYSQYTSGNHDNLTGTGNGTDKNIAASGWTYDSAGLSSTNDYYFTTSLLGGSTLTATLDWFVKATYTTTGSTPDYASGVDSRFDNLYLRLYTVSNGQRGTLVAESAADYITTQQLFFNIPQTGSYALEVANAGQRYTDGTTTATGYGLAWSDTGTTNALAPSAASVGAPEPGALALALSGSLSLTFGIVRRARRRA
jgi:hypothetical protein